MSVSLKTILTISISCTLLLGLISFSSVKHSRRVIHDVLINIEQEKGNYFIDQPEVLGLMNAQNTDYVLGSRIGDIDLKLLESRVEAHAFVADAQIFYDLKGNIVVNVEQARPIARIYDPYGADKYIDDRGLVLPINGKHTARVPLIEIEKKIDLKNGITSTEEGADLFELLRFIDADEFWKAQIAHLVFEGSGEITMLPQITKQKILFGKPSDLAKKFKKLEVFYKEILPNKGWNTYSLVNLKFKDQIVCE
ncbi:MAG: cell division protein FtsQ [Cytophagales bacterium]|nr:cell division protein FtsQ [Cytophagales bacterium]